MKTIELKQVEHSVRVGDVCEYKEANITESCILSVDGEPIGFYIKDLKKYKKLTALLSVANSEFRSKNVPKSNLNRVTAVKGQFKDGWKGNPDDIRNVSQFSTILGAVAPNPLVRRPYPNLSSVHREPKAKMFIKAMLGCALESEKIIKHLTPKLWENQKALFKDVDEKWRFGNIFTSSISNFNIAAPFHRDTGNIDGAVNVILTKRHKSKGGCLNVPDYNATFEQGDNSMLVYPARRNVHGVTPIMPEQEGGYRNSLIFYPLKAFKGI